jgi:hypothetical protein
MKQFSPNPIPQGNRQQHKNKKANADDRQANTGKYGLIHSMV